MRTSFLVLMAVVGGSLAACGPDSLGSVDEGGADELAIAEGELSADETAAVLAYVNGPEASYLRMTTEASIAASAANPIELHVRGADRVLGTADDDRCDTLAELDAITGVGAATLTRLANYAVPHYGPGATLVKDVAFSPDEQRDALEAANTADLSTNTLITADTWRVLVSKRPFATFAAIVTKVPALTTTDLLGLRLWAKTHPTVVPVGPAGACDGTGGTYDTVAFTKAEECKAVEFLNKARMSEMGALSAAARDLAWRSNPEGTWGFRTSRWTNLKVFSNRPNIGVTAMKAIKTSAATWTANGLSYDTIASVYATRTALLGKPVFLEKVVVTKVFPRAQDGDWAWDCAELRDTATSPNYLRGCFQYVGADSSSGCTATGACTVGMTGKTVSVGGFVRTTTLPGTGGTKLALSAGGFGAPNPNVP